MQPPSDGWVHSLYIPAHLNHQQSNESSLTQLNENPQLPTIIPGEYTVPVLPIHAQSMMNEFPANIVKKEQPPILQSTAFTVPILPKNAQCMIHELPAKIMKKEQPPILQAGE